MCAGGEEEAGECVLEVRREGMSVGGVKGK